MTTRRSTPRPTIDRWSLAPNLLAHSIRVALVTRYGAR